LAHIDICQEMVVIQCNNTEDLIATELAEMGIPRENIALGFLPPEMTDIRTPSNIMRIEHQDQAEQQALAA